MSKHKHLLEDIAHGRMPHNVAWREILDAVRHVGTVTEHGHHKLALEIDGRRLIVHAKAEHEVSSAEMSDLRHFLKQDGHDAQKPNGHDAEHASAAPAVWVLVVDHHEAHLYRKDHDEGSFEPSDPHGFRRHLIHRKESHYEGQRVPEDKDFYERIVTAVRSAPSLVVVGGATGKSNAAHVFLGHLEKHHKDLHGLVERVEERDLSALTPADIACMARESASQQQ